MNEIEKAFAELPPPSLDPRDAETAHAIWLRARMAAIVEDDTRARRLQRLRFASSAAFIAALDAVALLVVVSLVTSH